MSLVTTINSQCESERIHFTTVELHAVTLYSSWLLMEIYTEAVDYLKAYGSLGETIQPKFTFP